MERRIALVPCALLALWLGGCGNEPLEPPPGGTDSGVVGDTGNPCAIPCGTECCAAGQACVEGKCECAGETDGELCGQAGRVCGPLNIVDRCGKARAVSSCGSCTEGTCKADGSACEACVSETQNAFCDRLKKECGSVTAKDICGVERTFNCGSCGSGKECDLQTNLCKTICSDTDEDFCGRLGFDCGPASGTDKCGAPRTVSECGPCGTGDVCDPQQRCQVCIPETLEQFCSRLGRNCGDMTARDNCGVERTETCGSCTSPKECSANNTCALPGAPGNEDCIAPEILVFDPTTGIAMSHGDTTKASNTGDGSCAAGSGNDVVYEFILDSPKTVQITASPTTGSSLRPVLYVRTACGQPASEVRCAATQVVQTPGRLTLNRLDRGTYFLWVDGLQPSLNGAFDLTVAISEPPDPPHNNLCSGAQLLSFDSATGKAVASGDTRAATDAESATCATAAKPFNGGDVVFKFTLGTDQDVIAKVIRDPADSDFEPAIYLRRDCTSPASADEAACAVGSGGSATVLAPGLAAGTWYLFVDGVSHSSGRFSLEVTARAPLTNDNCTSPEVLAFSPAGVAVASGDTRLGTNDADGGACNNKSGNDVVFLMTLSAPKKVDIVVAPQPGSAFRPNVFVRKECGLESTELACKTNNNADSPASVSFGRLEKGTYHVWVAGWSDAYNGPFTLKATATDLVSNDTCDDPEQLTFDGTGTAVAQGDTRLGSDSGNGSCLSSTGADLVYRFETISEKYVEIEVKPDSGSGLRPNVYLRSDCGTASTQVACGTAGAAGLPAKVIARQLPAGRWFVWVDSYSASSTGPFTLQVKTLDQAPVASNDVCARPEQLNFDVATGKARVSASTMNANNHYVGRCATVGQPHDGADVVYTFELTAPASVTATVTRAVATPSFRPAVYLRKGDCESQKGSDEYLCGNDSNGTATATALNATPGIYYVIVDGVAGTSGDFDLEVSLGQALDLPDDCNSAKEIFLTSGAVTVTGDTTQATDKAHSLILFSSGNDLVYRFSTASDLNLTATLTFANGGNPTVYIRRVCDATNIADELAAKSDSSGTAEVTVNNLPAGTYWVWVDGSATTKGPFTLELTSTAAAAPPSNDGCVNAQAVDVSSGSGTVSGTTVNGRNRYNGSCDTRMHGGDVVYKFTIGGTDNKSAVAKVTRTGSSSYQPAVYIRSNCESSALADEKACGKMLASSDAVAYAMAPSLRPGTYFVIVDGSTADNGTFTLDLNVGPERTYPDTCARAEPLDFGTTGWASVTNDTSWATGATKGTCATKPSGPDYVYKIDTTSMGVRNLEAKLKFTAPGNYVSPLMYLRSACASTSATDELACKEAGSATSLTLRKPNLQPGVYYLWVDAVDVTEKGPFQLDVSMRPPVSNDTCAAPQQLTFNNYMATDFGFTLATVDNYSGTCNGGGMIGGDVVYQFEVSGTEPRSLTATVRRDPAFPDYQPAVYVRSKCDDSTVANQKACGTNASGTAVAHADNLSPGTYYLIVDGLTANGGAFDLAVELAEIEVFPDTCATPREVRLDRAGHAMVVGDTTNAANDYASAGCIAATGNGNDLVYKIDTSGFDGFDFAATVTYSGSGIYPLLYLRNDCANSTESAEVACAMRTSGGPLTLRKETLPGGVYYLVVDVASKSDKGAFTLELQMTPPPEPPSNGTCAAAAQLTPDASTGKVSVTGWTRNGTNLTTGTCGAMNGPEVVYALNLPQEALVTFKVTADSSSPNFKPALYVRGDCTSAAATDQRACAVSTTTSGVTSASATVLVLPAGISYVYVDGTVNTYGKFTLDVTTAPALHGDICTDAVPLTFDGSGVASFTSDTTLASADVTSSCGWRDTGDLVYKFTLPTPKKLEVQVIPAAGTGTRQFTASVRRGTCEGSKTDLVCAYASTSGGTTVVNLPKADADTYYVWVEGYNNWKGAFTLKVITSDLPAPPDNDVCTGAPTLTFNAAGKVSISGDTTYATDGGAGSCNANSIASDLVYAFTLQKESQVIAKVTRDSSTPKFLPVVYIRSDCESSAPSDERACGKQDNGVATAAVRILSAGTHYVVVDGERDTLGVDTFGKFTLDISTGPAFHGDLCSDAVQLAFDANGVAQASGDLTLASDAARGLCGSSTKGPDQVFAFTLNSPKNVDVTVTPSDSVFQPIVFLRQKCIDNLTEIACKVAASAGKPGQITYPRLAAGTWYVWVEGNNDSNYVPTKGAFALKVVTTEPVQAPPVNDTCRGGAEEMTWDSVAQRFKASGDTALGTHDTSGTCDPSLGPDLVYWFTTNSAQKVTIQVARDKTNSPNFEPVIYLRRFCDRGSAADERTCAKHSTGTAKIVVNDLPADTWYLWVDGAKGTSGKFTAEVMLESPVTGPANEACFAPQVLTLPGSIPGTISVSGTTLLAQNDAASSTSCGWSSYGPDVVYELTTLEDHKLTATVKQATFPAAIYIRKGCGSVWPNDELICKSTKDLAGVTATLKYLPAGTYHLWIDAGDVTTGGDFVLDVTLEAPIRPPSNNTCANPEVLTKGTPVKGNTVDAQNNYFGLFGACKETVAGPEVVYQYTPATSGSFTVTVDPIGFDAVLWMTVGTCGDVFTCAAESQTLGSGKQEKLTVNGVAGTTYFFFVDGFSSTHAGEFNIQVQ